MTFRMSDLSDLARKRVAVAAYYFVPGLVFAVGQAVFRM